MTVRLPVIGLGAVTPVGLGAASTCAAIRAGISAYTATDVRDRSHGPTLCAEVPLRPRPADARPFGRLCALASAALRECVMSGEVVPERSALLLGVREPFRSRGTQAWSDAELLKAVGQMSGLTFHPRSQILPHGNASVFLALARARELLSGGQVETCIVGGVDTLLTPTDVDIFGSAYRLKSDDVAQGFVPSEGAAFLAVCTGARVNNGVDIAGIGLAEEDSTSTVLSDAPATGSALERALLASFADAGLPESSISFRSSDMNGETYRGHETMLALMRVYRTRREHLPQFLPAASVGETGAASGALTLAMAVTALMRGYAPGRVAACEASSDGGLRGACVVLVSS